MSTDEKNDGFLSRWAKRKEQVRDEAVLEDAPTEVEAGAPEIDVEPETDDEALELLRERDPELAEKIGEIDIDKLQYEDDFSIFMNDKVPEFIRRKALSKLWLASPILANVDGLNDYDEDFRDAGDLIEAAKTALAGRKKDGEPGDKPDDTGSAVKQEQDIESAGLEPTDAETAVPTNTDAVDGVGTKTDSESDDLSSSAAVVAQIDPDRAERDA